MGNVTTRQYDTLGRVTSEVDPDAGAASFQYDGFGAPVWEQHAAGVPVVWDRDALGRPKSRQDQDGDQVHVGHGAERPSTACRYFVAAPRADRVAARMRSYRFP